MNSSPLYFASADVRAADEAAQDAQFLDARKDPRAIEQWLRAAALYEAAARRVPVEELPFTRRMLATSAHGCLSAAGEVNAAARLWAELFPGAPSAEEREMHEARRIMRQLGA